MSSQHPVRSVALLIASLATTSSAQQAVLPPVHDLGRIERISTDHLASVTTALPMPGGRVMVNDMTARRVLLFDSTLTKAFVVADSTNATGSAYGKNAGTLIAYRGDSALFIDVASLSMLVLSPTGTIARVMAIPHPDDAQYLIGDVFGLPGFDARGRLAHYAGNPGGTPLLCCLGVSHVREPGKPAPVFRYPDSAFVVRSDLDTRTMDTAASFKIPKVRTRHNADADGFIRSLQIITDPLPVIDDWTVAPDGSLAVVRGRDFHVDWLMPDGQWQSLPKIPFDWRPVSDERKVALIDSATRANQAGYDRLAASPRGTGAAGGRGGGGSASARGGGVPIPLVAGRPELSDVADYVPAFTRAAVYADAESNLWIRTTTMVKAQPVYDVVNHRGELIDRVQLPPFRTIAGFASGVVYMAVRDNAGVVHLERGRIK